MQVKLKEQLLCCSWRSNALQTKALASLVILFDCYGNLKYPKSLDTETTPITMVTITTYDAYVFRQEERVLHHITTNI